MKNLLHVGCGHTNITHLSDYFHTDEWDEIRLDIDPSVEPDIIGTLQDMSLIESGSMDVLYSSHNIEHVWTFEVPKVLQEFYRVLKPRGLGIILCPDILSVAQAITAGYLNKTLYESTAGPISAMDILYGLGSDLEGGRHYMAHKTAFTADSLGESLIKNGFAQARIIRDKMFGLHALAFKQPMQEYEIQDLSEKLLPERDLVLEVFDFLHK